MSWTESWHSHFDFAKLSGRDKYKLIIGTVIPRPIALVTTVDANGIVNAAPFSFLNALSGDPAIVAIGVENKANVDFKDTGRNIRHTEQFTVNIVDDAMVEAMNICAVPFSPDVDELRTAGLTAVAGTHVGCPRILQSPAALEGKRYLTLAVGKSREIILGEVLSAFIRSDSVDPVSKHVDQVRIQAVGRMGGHDYASTKEQFTLPTLSLEVWMKKNQKSEQDDKMGALGRR
jgi:flavin reductase (DIM6/NTAB) family NADH-FMN oxidoreductase RutF